MRVAWVLGLVLSVLPRIAHGEEDRPDKADHFKRGTEHFEKQEYAAAAAEFNRGFVATGEALFLYSGAQAERLGGNCAEAIKKYELFLTTGPSDSEANAARINIERCKAVLPLTPEGRADPSEPILEPPPLSESEPEVAVQPPRPPPLPPPDIPSEPASLLPGHVLVGVGVGLGLAAGGLFIGAEVLEASAEVYAEAEPAERMRIAGWVLTAGASAAAGAAVIAYVAQATRPGPRGPSPTVMLGPSFVGVQAAW